MYIEENFFRKLERVNISSPDVIKSLNLQRSVRNDFDINFVKSKSKYIDIGKLTNTYSAIENGRYTIIKGSARFECLFHKGSGDKLFILLSAARTAKGGKKRPIPRFNRWSWYSNTDDNWLCIEDPMYFYNDKIQVGWFYGTKNENYRAYLAEIARFFSTRLNIKSENIVFYGSSAGGPAALHAASLLEGSTGVSINGQYNYEYSRFDIEDFKKELGIDLKLKDKYDRNNVACWFNNKSKYIIIGNIRSKWDRQDHLIYLANKIGKEISVGLNQFNNLIVWIYEANGYLGSPHSSFEDKTLFWPIYFLISLQNSKLNNIEKYKNLYSLFNEIWFDKYEEQKKLICTDGIVQEDPIYEAYNFTIDAKDDRWFNYKLPISLEKNIQYRLELDLIPHRHYFTIGIFDWKNKKFRVRKDVKCFGSLYIEFSLQSSDDKTELLIFPGIHGECNNKKLYIKRLRVFKKNNN